MNERKDTDVEVKDQLPDNWSNKIVELLYGLFQTQAETDEVLRVLEIAGGKEVPAYIRNLPQHEMMNVLVRRMFQRIESNNNAFFDVRETLVRAEEVLSKNPFIDTFHNVMHAAKDIPEVMRVLYGLLLLMDAGQLDDCQVPEIAWKRVSARAKPLGGTFSGDECLGSIDDLVERVMARMYRGDLDDAVAWQALSDMLLEVCPCPSSVKVLKVDSKSVDVAMVSVAAVPVSKKDGPAPSIR
jgi:hypothetical protein